MQQRDRRIDVTGASMQNTGSRMRGAVPRARSVVTPKPTPGLRGHGGGARGGGFPELAPDLGVQVLSPDDRPGEVLGKVAEYLSAGTRLVWVIDPERRLARVYRADGTEETVTADQALQGEDVVPGFACPLASIL